MYISTTPLAMHLRMPGIFKRKYSTYCDMSLGRAFDELSIQG